MKMIFIYLTVTSYHFMETEQTEYREQEDNFLMDQEVN